MQQYYDPYGAAPQYAPQGFIGDLAGMAGGLAQQYLPFGADPQFAPQGAFGNFFSNIAPTLGGAIGGRFGNANLGRQIGGIAGNLGRRYIPFGAGPEFGPQGYAGDPGGMAGQYAPYGADPQFAPQNWLGDAFSAVKRTVSHPFVRQALPHIRRFLPFGAEADFAPQGYADAGGGMADPYAPYGADPQFAPQGAFGNFFSNIAPTLGGAIGGRFGNANLGRQIGGIAGNLGRRYIPFGAGPEFGPQGYAGDPGGGMAGQYAPYGADPQFAPQGMFGNLMGRLLPIAGGIWGGPLGGMAGQGAGALARRYIPFGVDPSMMQEWA